MFDQFLFYLSISISAAFYFRRFNFFLKYTNILYYTRRNESILIFVFDLNQEKRMKIKSSSKKIDKKYN